MSGLIINCLAGKPQSLAGILLKSAGKCLFLAGIF